MTFSRSSFTSSKTALPSLSKTIPYKLACSLRWRQGKLWISTMVRGRDIPLPALASEEWFQACLARSQAQAVCIDPELGKPAIDLWLRACEASQKPLYLRIPSLSSLPQKQHPIAWCFKRLCDFTIAAILLIALSPLMLLLAGLIEIEDGGPVFYTQWRVGARGKVFRIYKFRSMIVDAEKLHDQVMSHQQGLHKLERDPRVTFVGKWMRKFSLDELPQLINVLRGEMSLVGPRPWAIYDAVRIPKELHHRLNALPGMTGAWQVEARSEELNICTVNQRDLNYLEDWSIAEDFKFLLLTVPQVMKDIRAY